MGTTFGKPFAGLINTAPTQNRRNPFLNKAHHWIEWGSFKFKNSSFSFFEIEEQKS
ncbi:unnamed protein product [Brassica napus]|uniref:(rape) hypothetical protein n=1 Tax=Brassica napus TaxID=3708 RepID=A0A817B093_BRANA|nr:unnamed protein product [Brassica napus]